MLDKASEILITILLTIQCTAVIFAVGAWLTCKDKNNGNKTAKK